MNLFKHFKDVVVGELEKMAEAGDLLLTAHHQDDQAETLLLQLLRGSGPAGLAAMPACVPFATGWLVRPLLGFHRQELIAYLEDAGLALDEVDYISAHGTGTAANDANETQAIRRAFGNHADQLAVSSTKSMHGHALGAAGGIEAVATVRSIAESVAPPTVNYETEDPECDLDYVANEARPLPIRAALSNSFAFGGLNAVLAFRRVDD